VREVMSTHLVSVDPSASLTQSVGAMSAANSGSVIVMDRGSLVGILTERDVMRALAFAGMADRARVASVDGWMTRDPVTIEPDATVADALNQMLFRGFRHLPVTEGGNVVRAVSMRDLARSIADA
jgi:CBS domain-containing protein